MRRRCSLTRPALPRAIYGLEKTADFTALVMELVEGEDLSQRIPRGPIPLDEAMPIAKQIADALEAAHEKGIVYCVFQARQTSYSGPRQTAWSKCSTSAWRQRWNLPQARRHVSMSPTLGTYLRR